MLITLVMNKISQYKSKLKNPSQIVYWHEHVCMPCTWCVELKPFVGLKQKETPCWMAVLKYWNGINAAFNTFTVSVFGLKSKLHFQDLSSIKFSLFAHEWNPFVFRRCAFGKESCTAGRRRRRKILGSDPAVPDWKKRYGRIKEQLEPQQPEDSGKFPWLEVNCVGVWVCGWVT